MKGKNLLPRRLNLIADESLASYIYRLGKENGHNSVRMLASALGSSVAKTNNNEFTADALNAISMYSGLPYEVLNKASANSYKAIIGNTNYDRYILKNKVKYCPECINNLRYHRIKWFLHPLHICLEHNVELVEVCPLCKSSISMNSLMIGKCLKCDTSLKSKSIITSQLNQFNPIYLESQFELYKWIFDQSFRFKDNISPEMYLNLMHSSFYLLSGMPDFINSGNGQILACHNNSGRVRSGTALSNAFANAYWLYNEFPQNFNHVLEEFYLRKNKWSYSKKAKFEEIFSNPVYGDIYTAYKTFWVRKSDEGAIRVDFSLFKKDPTLLKSRAFLRKDEVQRVARIGSHKLRRLQEQNKLTIVSLSKRKQLLGTDTFEQLARDRNGLITKTEVGLLLGIRSSNLNKLVNGDLLSIVKNGTYKYKKYSLDEVRELMNKCRGRVIREPQGVNINKLMAIYNRFGLSIVELLRLTLEGKINPITRVEGGTLKDNYYDIDEVFNCLKEKRGNSSVG